MKYLRSKPFLACYEGEPTPEPVPTPKTFTQEDVNAFLKKEKESYRKQAEAERQKLAQQLEAIQQDKTTTEETKAQLEAQLEELRQANMTAEERAAIALKKAEKEASEKYGVKEKEALEWRGRHDSLMVGYGIMTEFGGPDIMPGSLQFVEAYLKPRTRLVEDIDPESNKGRGTFTPKVKMTVKGKDDKPVEMDLTIAEAKKIMVDDTENFGFIFRTSAASGLGAGTEQPGKKASVKNMTPEQYAKVRKENPASLNL